MRTRSSTPPSVLGCLLIGMASAGCQGNVNTTVLKSGDLVPGRVLPGVIFYPPQYVKITHSFRSLVNADGQIVGVAPQACTPAVQKQEVTIMPDFGTPMMMSNNSGAFSAAKFSVALSNGLLVSVNSEPTQKLSEILSSSTALLTRPAAVLARPGQPGLRPPCNAGPEISDFRKTTLSAE